MNRLGRALEVCRGPLVLVFEPEKPVASYQHPVLGDAIPALFRRQAGFMLGELEDFQHVSYLMRVDDGTYAGSYRRVVESRNPTWRQGDTALSKPRARAGLQRIIEGRDNGSKADASLRSNIYYRLTHGWVGNYGDENYPELRAIIAFGCYHAEGISVEEREAAYQELQMKLRENDPYNVPFEGQF